MEAGKPVLVVLPDRTMDTSPTSITAPPAVWRGSSRKKASRLVLLPLTDNQYYEYSHTFTAPPTARLSVWRGSSMREAGNTVPLPLPECHDYGCSS